LSSRLRRLSQHIDQRRELTLRYRRLLAEVPGLLVPFTADSVLTSSGYVMPVIAQETSRRDRLRIALRERHGVQTSVFYPPVHKLAAYAERFPGVSLPLTERWAQNEITLPLFPHLTAADQDRVVEALARELSG
jgi:dTDP-4-amino-4,6-dideoxygalactose transaminase